MPGRRELVLLLASTYSFFAALSGVTAIIARYARALGYSVAATGAMFSALPLAAAVLRIPVGAGADRLGGRVFMVSAGVLAGAAGAVAALSHSLGGLVAARGLQGAALAFFVAPSINAASLIPGVPASRAISFRSASISAASTVSPFVASVLVDRVGYAAGFAYAAAMGVAAAAAAAPLRPGGGYGRSYSLRGALRAARLIAPIIVTSMIDGFVLLGFQSLPQAQLRDMGYPASVFGAALALSGAAGFASRLWASRLAPRLGCPAAMLSGYAAAAAGLVVLAARVAPPGVEAAGALYGFGLGLVVPSEQMLIVMSVSERVRNTVISLYALGFDVGGFLGSALLGALAQSMGYTASYHAMVAAEAVEAAVIASWALGRGLLRRCTASPPPREPRGL